MNFQVLIINCIGSRRSGAGVGVVGGIIYAVGGHDGETQ